MKLNKYKYILLLLLTMLFLLGGTGQHGVMAKKLVPLPGDTLHTEEKTLTAYNTQSDKALQANLYAARFHVQKQQQEIERQKAGKQYVTMVAFLIGILAMLGLFFAWYAARQWRKTQLKNRVLAKQIKKAFIYKNRYDELKQQFLQSTPCPSPRVEGISDTLSIDPAIESDLSTIPSGGSLDSLSPEELFHYIEHEVSRQLLFLNPSFDRQMIMDEFHITKERVGAAFSQGSKYDSLPQFVNDLRLEYASKLLVTTDLSITEIMSKAGFSNASVFSRYFSRKFQISPTQYRRANSEA